MRVVFVFFIVLSVLSLGSRGSGLALARNRVRPAGGHAVAPALAAMATPSHPLCGTLVDVADERDRDRTLLLVPERADAPKVNRLDVIDKTRTPMRLLVFAGWWVCVTRGRIVARPGTDYAQHGTIEVEAISIDQFNGERGQE